MSRVEVFLRDGEGVDLLVNNAGFGMVGAFATIELTEHLRMLQLHVIASMRLAHAALPAMLERGTGGIINVSSVAGFVQGGNITYHTTKSFLIEFSQSLNREVAWKGVRVQALCPGYTWTEFHDPPELSAIRNSRLPGFMWLDAENVVKESLKALDQNQVICVPGMAYKIIVFLVRSPLIAPLVNLIAVRMRKRVA
jgi:hypothetical protein